MKITPKEFILIFSDESDYSTIQVAEWLNFYQQRYFILTEKDEIVLLKLTNEELEFIVNKQFILKSCEIKNYWYRRGSFGKISGIEIEKLNLKFPEIRSEILNYFNTESFKLRNFIYIFLSSKFNGISNFLTSEVNKLNCLRIATNLGIKVPEFTVVSSKRELMSFFKLHKNIISKPIGSGILKSGEKHSYLMYTKLIDKEDIEKIPNIFFPTFFQIYIEKEFEIRTFYLQPDFYSMAIFSQTNEKTKVDFRNYDDSNPNRCIPFKLEEEFESKLRSLMKKLNLNTGSIDIIVSRELEYYFLEVNPVGQFGMVSYPCNYGIEKLIAENLINNGKK